MFEINIKMEDREIADKILWLLRAFENSGVEIETKNFNSSSSEKSGEYINKELCLETFNDILNGNLREIKAISKEEHFKELGI